MVQLFSKLMDLFDNAVMPKTTKEPLSEMMNVSIHDLTQLLSPFIKPRDLSAVNDNKNGLQLAIDDLSRAISDAIEDKHDISVRNMRNALASIAAHAVPKGGLNTVAIPRADILAFQNNRKILEQAAFNLKKEDSFNSIAAADRLIKVDDQATFFLSKNNPEREQKLISGPRQARAHEQPVIRSPRPKFLGGVPRQ